MTTINTNQIHLLANTPPTCSSTSSFFSFPTWYEYLQCTTTTNGNQIPTIGGISDIWLIVLAIINIMLTAAALIAVFFIIYGGIKYITSQANPEQTNKARNVVLSAVVGLVICIVADVVVSFIAGSIN